MNEIDNMVKLTMDILDDNVATFSRRQSMDVLRQAMIECNNGSTKLDIRAIRDGKCTGLFSYMEQILKSTIPEGLQGNEYFNTLCEYVQCAPGERVEFNVEDTDLFEVSEAADGTYGVRRQRIGGYGQVVLKPTMKVVKCYEELGRVLAGFADVDEMVAKVSDSFKQRLLMDIYTCWAGATQSDFGGKEYFPAAGSYDEDELLDIISHVEASAGGRVATLLGTSKALRNLKIENPSDAAKRELETMGYYGNFHGNNVMKVPQRHKPGTNEFIFNDDEIYIIASDSKPIKVVHEGDPIVLLGDPLQTKDFTQEYFYGEKYAVGLVVSGRGEGIGKYKIA